MILCRIDIPGSPVAKGRPRFARATGRAYTPAKTANAEAFIKMLAVQAMRGKEIVTGPVAVKMWVHMAIPASWSKVRKQQALYMEIRPTGRPDLDNVFKMLDALNGIVWQDDAQIVEAEIMKRYSAEPMTTVIVTRLGAA